MKLNYYIETFTEKELIINTKQLEYWIILSGSGTIASPGQNKDFHTHDLLSIPANCTGKIIINTPNLILGRITIQDYDTYKKEITYTPAHYTEYIRKTFSYIIDIRGLNDPNFKTIYDSLDNVMFMILAMTGLYKRHDNPIIFQVIEIVNANFRNPDFDIMKVIEGTGYSKSHFRKKFKDIVTVSPVTFVNNMRLDYACALMKESSGLSIKDISLQCGFKDPLYFTRLFKNRYDVTPSAYIKTLQ